MLTCQPLWAVKAWNDSSYAATAFSSQRREVSVALSPPVLPPAPEPLLPEPPGPLSPLSPEGQQAAAKEERRVRRLSMRRSFRDDGLLQYPPSAGRTGECEHPGSPSARPAPRVSAGSPRPRNA